MDRADVGDLSARELTVRLGGQLSALVREEMALVKAELFASARQAFLGGALLITAAILGLTGWLARGAPPLSMTAASVRKDIGEPRRPSLSWLTGSTSPASRALSHGGWRRTHAAPQPARSARPWGGSPASAVPGAQCWPRSRRWPSRPRSGTSAALPSYPVGAPARA